MKLKWISGIVKLTIKKSKNSTVVKCGLRLSFHLDEI